MNVAHRLSYASSSWKSLCGAIRSSRNGSSHVHLRWYSSHVVKNGRPFRMAVIGSGPAAFYTANQVMSKIKNATVDMFEKLPVPFGLVRFGVAPDHPEVKNCQEKFSDLASLPNFNFIGNVDVGKELPLASLMSHYNSVLFSYGASEDRKLGIPGEDANGVYSARDFVGWYNGLPENDELVPRLDACEEAVIIGQGNVALDVARILLSDVDRLKKTDIADRAIATLSKSRVRRVRIVGRRGPMQAAFTIREIRELLTLDGTFFHKIDPMLFPPGSPKTLRRTQRRMVELLSKGSTALLGPKSWSLNFLLSPKSFERKADKLSSILFSKNTMQGADVFDPSGQASSTMETLSLSTNLAFRSIGYKSEPLLGMEDLGIRFNRNRGIMPCDQYGRVMNLPAGESASTHLPGLYCSGWVKRGPAGVIANTMEDAFATAEAIANDWQNEKPFLTGCDGWEGLKLDTGAQGLRSVGWSDWLKIDNAEKERGRGKGKQREKFTTVPEMLRVLD